MLLPPNILTRDSDRSVEELGDLSSELDRGQGFSESAEIIAEVLSLVLIDQTKLSSPYEETYEEIIRKNLKENPLLLYYTSIELLHTVNPEFANIVANYWKYQLCPFLCSSDRTSAQWSKHEKEARGSSAKWSKQEKEARNIILNLITRSDNELETGQHRQASLPATSTIATASDAHRRSLHGSQATDLFTKEKSNRCRIGKRIALANESHLSLLPGLISTETHFAQLEIYVEETNFESTLLRLKRASPTSLTFVIVKITGRISREQLQSILKPMPAIKLIFSYSSSIVDQLELMTTFSDVIHWPDSIKDEKEGKLRPFPYSSKSAVGSVVEHTQALLSENPELISSPGKFWDDDVPVRAVEEASQWKDNIKQWLKQSQYEEQSCAESDSRFVRILITPDEKATAEELTVFLEKMEPPTPTVTLVDAGERSKFDDLKNFFDSKSPAASFSYSNSVPSANGMVDRKSHISTTSEVFILSSASFLCPRRLEMLISKCSSSGTKLLLLVAEAKSSMSRFRVEFEDSTFGVRIRVPILTQKLVGGTSEPNAVDDSAHLVFVGLQLIFSPEAVVTKEHENKVRKFLESKDPKFLDFLEIERSHKQADISRHTLNSRNDDAAMRFELTQALAQGEDVHMDKCSLAVVIAVHVHCYVKFRIDPSPLKLTSFSDFCRQPKVFLKLS